MQRVAQKRSDLQRLPRFYPRRHPTRCARAPQSRPKETGGCVAHAESWQERVGISSNDEPDSQTVSLPLAVSNHPASRRGGIQLFRIDAQLSQFSGLEHPRSRFGGDLRSTDTAKTLGKFFGSPYPPSGVFELAQAFRQAQHTDTSSCCC